MDKLEKYLKKLRLTISQQEEIIELVKKLINQNKDERDSNI